MRKYLLLFALSLLSPVFFISSCSVNYSFTGADIPAEAKTLSVGYFKIEGKASTLANPIASDLFTNNLTATMLTQTNLDVIIKDGDLQFTGSIVGYFNTPVAPQADSEASNRNRLQMVVEVSYLNTIEPEKSFEKRRFSQFVDFDADENLTDIEEVLIEEISNAISQDIFNSSVGSW